eukprot:scaffold101403_cov62-Phaeocystis_antarctica.AAC.2
MLERHQAARRWHSPSGGPSCGGTRSESSGEIAPSSRHLTWLVLSFCVAHMRPPAAATRAAAAGEARSSTSGLRMSRTRMLTLVSALGAQLKMQCAALVCSRLSAAKSSGCSLRRPPCSRSSTRASSSLRQRLASAPSDAACALRCPPAAPGSAADATPSSASMAPISRSSVLLLSLSAQASMASAAEVAVSAEAVVRK